MRLPSRERSNPDTLAASIFTLPFAETPAREKRQIAAPGRECVRSLLHGDPGACLAIVEPEVSREQVVRDCGIIGVAGLEEECDCTVARDQAARQAGRELAAGRRLRAGNAEEDQNAFHPSGPAHATSVVGIAGRRRASL